MEKTEATTFFVDDEYNNAWEFQKGFAAAACCTTALFFPWESARIIGVTGLSFLASRILYNSSLINKPQNPGSEFVIESLQVINRDNQFVNALFKSVINLGQALKTLSILGTAYAILAKTPVPYFHLKTITLLQFSAPLVLCAGATLLASFIIARFCDNYYDLDSLDLSKTSLNSSDIEQANKEYRIVGNGSTAYGRYSQFSAGIVGASIIAARIALTLL